MPELVRPDGTKLHYEVRGEELVRITKLRFPDAHVEWLEPGPISNPDRAAELLRAIAAPLREAAAERSR